MVDREPSVKDMAKLWQICAEFIEQQRIYDAEIVYQYDRVIENGYRLIEQICDVVGYVDREDEDEDE